jgi:hypothetical protein
LHTCICHLSSTWPCSASVLEFYMPPINRRSKNLSIHTYVVILHVSALRRAYMNACISCIRIYVALYHLHLHLSCGWANIQLQNHGKHVNAMNWTRVSMHVFCACVYEC